MKAIDSDIVKQSNSMNVIDADMGRIDENITLRLKLERDYLQAKNATHQVADDMILVSDRIANNSIQLDIELERKIQFSGIQVTDTLYLLDGIQEGVANVTERNRIEEAKIAN